VKSCNTCIIPLKKWFGDLRSCSQGGIRNASATVFYPVQFSLTILSFLKTIKELKSPECGTWTTGSYCQHCSGAYSKTKKTSLSWSKLVPIHMKPFHSNTQLFEELYTRYEKRKDLRKKSMSAEEVFKSGILKERTDTGRIYLVFIDNVMKQVPLLSIIPFIKVIYAARYFTKNHLRDLDDEEGRIALCTLGSINWGVSV
jgi:ribonucleoside-diphosphate reductase alpha chain